MTKLTVAFQGEPGAYSEAAAYEHFGRDIQTLPCKTFDEAFDSVTQGKSSCGILPIENTLAGSIHRNFDLLLRHELTITGEYYLRVRHCLIGLPDARLEDIQQALSHPAALAQCETSLERLGIERIPEYDTAGSVRIILERNDPHIGAIASKHAAQVYNLKVLQEDLEDNPENYTRFLILSKEAPPVDALDAIDDEYKTSIVFTLDNKPGVLFKAMSVFALREIDLTKIESRPLIGKPWEYLFYIDFIGNIKSKNCTNALAHLEEIAPFIRVLGSYKRGLINGNTN
jgi:prephenate dehydratase